MKKLILLTLSMFLLIEAMYSQESNSEIRLLIRGDDIGSFHAANLGCIRSYTEGIMRSVEVMVPAPWFPEAVQMLNDNPGLDVGIHLVLTSEWSSMKWRPLTGISSITDSEGYFYPMVWTNENFGPERAFIESEWNLEDVEKELRAQIELALEKIENISHISTHMGFSWAHPDLQKLVEKLTAEYGLQIEMEGKDVRQFKFDNDRNDDYLTRAQKMADAILKLEPGTYIFVEHPAMDTPEMETVGHTGYEDVGKDREGVTRMFTSQVVMDAVREKKVKLISYQDL